MEIQKMESKTRKLQKDLQKQLQQKHPNWPEQKSKWVAMRVLGIVQT